MVAPRRKRKTRLREVPIDLHNEQMILASMMQDDNAADYFRANLRRSDFIGQRHRVLFTALGDMKSLSFSEDTLMQVLKQSGATVKEAGGFSYVKTINKEYSPLPKKNWRKHSDDLRLSSAKIKMWRELSPKLDASLRDHAAGVEDIDKLLTEFKGELASHQSVALWNGDSLGDSYLEHLKDRQSGGHFVPLGFPELDAELTEGFARRKVSVIAARPGMGKTTAVANIINRVAHTQNKRVLVGAFEAGRYSMMDSWVSNMTDIPLTKLIREPHTLTRRERVQIKAATKKILNGNLINLWDGDCRFEQLEKYLSIKDWDVVVLDLFERMLSRIEPGHITVRLSQIQQLAKDYDTHVCLVHQLNRGAAGKPSRRDASRVPPPPTMVDLKNSGAFEEIADLILLLHRDAYYNVDLAGTAQDVVNINIAKQRWGMTGARFNYQFVGKFSRIGDFRSEDDLIYDDEDGLDEL